MGRTHRLAGGVALGLLGLAFAAPAVAQSRLEQIDAFLMERGEEIALARSAAPRGVGDAAAVYVLTSDGYELAADGSNGFACFVGRGWSGPVIVDAAGIVRVSPDAFDPTIRAPHCFNPLAVKSILPWHLLRTDALVRGVPAEEIPKAATDALAAGKLSVPEAGSIAYMTSSQQHLGGRFGHWRPHVMVYTPFATNPTMGAPGFSNDFPFVAEAGTAWAVTVMQLRAFSDGTTPELPAAGDQD